MYSLNKKTKLFIHKSRSIIFAKRLFYGIVFPLIVGIFLHSCGQKISKYSDANTPKYDDIDIPNIEDVIENFSINVLLPSNWNVPNSKVYYNLQGKDTTNSSWIPILGEAGTLVQLSPTDSQNIRVMVPKFDINESIIEYRLVFYVQYVPKGDNDTLYQKLGAVALNDGTHDNNGSIAGYTYTLKWAPNNLSLIHI